MNDTSLQIAGNLTADPELRHTTSGTPVCRLRVAASPRRYDRGSHQWVDGETNFLDIEIWAGAENVAGSLLQR